MSINRWMDKKDVHYIYDRILLSRKKKNKILSFVTTLMDLERIILSKSDRERQKSCNITYVESKTYHKRTYLQNRNRLTDIENKPKRKRGVGVGYISSMEQTDTQYYI